MGVRITSEQLKQIQDGQEPPKRSVSQKKAQQGGEDWEAALDVAHAYLAVNEFAWMERHSVPTKTVFKGGQTVRVAIGKAPFDFSGVLGHAAGLPGHFVAIEAKRTSTRPKKAMASLKIRQNDQGDGLGANQLRSLQTRHVVYGAVVGVVWWNVDRCGVISGFGLSRLKANATRIMESQFTWLASPEEYIGVLVDEYA